MSPAAAWQAAVLTRTQFRRAQRLASRQRLVELVAQRMPPPPPPPVVASPGDGISCADLEAFRAELFKPQVVLGGGFCNLCGVWQPLLSSDEVRFFHHTGFRSGALNLELFEKVSPFNLAKHDEVSGKTSLQDTSGWEPICGFGSFAPGIWHVCAASQALAVVDSFVARAAVILPEPCTSITEAPVVSPWGIGADSDADADSDFLSGMLDRFWLLQALQQRICIDVGYAGADGLVFGDFVSCNKVGIFTEPGVTATCGSDVFQQRGHDVQLDHFIGDSEDVEDEDVGKFEDSWFPSILDGGVFSTEAPAESPRLPQLLPRSPFVTIADAGNLVACSWLVCDAVQPAIAALVLENGGAVSWHHD